MTNIVFDNQGNVKSLRSGAMEFAAPGDLQGLFIIQFRDSIGNPFRLTEENFANCTVTEKDGNFTLVYDTCNDIPDSTVEVTVLHKADGLHWNISIDCKSPFLKTEWVDFPRLHFKNDTAEKWLLPFAEGTLISDLKKREEFSFFKCQYAEYPMTGVNSFYPGPAPMQYEACYNAEAGICIICADPTHAPKTVDVYPVNDDAACLMLQHFTGGKNTLEYDVIVSGFQGDWQDATELYRNWMEKNDPYLPGKQYSTMPQWLKDSPTFLIYSVKGQGRDLGDLRPNEYYPYNNALPVVERYRKLWGGNFTTVLMHWEGTAPWAPPYVWPPYGGEEELKNFVETMHANGDRVGLYASGIGWTQQSMTDTSYTLYERFEKENVGAEICIGPRDEKFSRVCNGLKGQRIGYDLCPGREFTARTISNEIRQAAAAGVDYLQFFDQNQGCASPLCYAKNHGHPELPGKWETDSMRQLLKAAVESGKGMTIGCENAAAQPYTEYCKLNDLRYHLAWHAGGIPVPAYPYLFHEYTAGFSGNGVCLAWWIDMAKTPFFLLWQLAWNFAYGNFLSVVLKNGGDIHWNWAIPWTDPMPEQEPICKLMANLASLRRELSENYLAAGRMLKAPKVECGTNTVYPKRFAPVEVPRIVASSWQGIDGKNITILVNYNAQEESCRLFDKTITIPAYNAVIIENSVQNTN